MVWVYSCTSKSPVLSGVGGVGVVDSFRGLGIGSSVPSACLNSKCRWVLVQVSHRRLSWSVCCSSGPNGGVWWRGGWRSRGLWPWRRRKAEVEAVTGYERSYVSTIRNQIKKPFVLLLCRRGLVGNVSNPMSLATTPFV